MDRPVSSSPAQPASTFLLVEDNPDDVILIQRAFRKAAIQAPVYVVNDGEQALAYLAGENHYADRSRYPLPACVLLDWKLPRKNGLEVLSWIRSRSQVRRLPVVVLTSSRESPDIEAAYDAGANSYLLKPVEFETLRELIASLGLYWLVLNVPPELTPGH